MLYDLSDAYQLAEFHKAVARLLEAGAVVELKKKREARSLSQNAYAHLLIGYFASQYGCGVDEAKVDFFKRAANAVLFERHTQGRAGTRLRSSADLSKEEMTLAIDRFKNWSASVAGIYLPEATDSRFLMHAQREVEKNKEYDP